MHRHNLVTCTTVTLTRVLVMLLVDRRLAEWGGRP